MDRPAEEWERSAELEPVRIEIPWNAPRPKLERGDWRVLLIVFFIFSPMAFILALDTFRESGWGEVVFVAVFTMLTLPLVLLIQRAYLRSRNDAHRHVVRLEGEMLTVERFNSGDLNEESFPLLEIHDLRVAPGWEYLGEGVVRGVGTRYRLDIWDMPERLVFTFAGRAYSFGGAVSDDVAERVYAQIRDYDARLRASLGMATEPNIATYDVGRVAAATRDGYDVNKSPCTL